jgi:phage terminase Nu1 subunit (DNA packaging protein)
MADLSGYNPSLLRDFLTRKQLAVELDVCVRTIERFEDRGLPVLRLGRRPLYDPEAVRKWILGQ